MNTGTITAVGIDVSKHKSTVAARRPGGEVVLLPFDVEHTADLCSYLVFGLSPKAKPKRPKRPKRPKQWESRGQEF